MADAPEDLQYTEDHLWVRPGNGDEVRIGLTAVGVQQLGEVLGVTLPEVGDELTRGDVALEVDTDADSVDIDAPLSGQVVAVNQVVVDAVSVLASDPYGDGWLAVLELADPSELDDLLDADGYEALADSS
ncbi:MAG: glycine cleavage system protein GcvH [Acidipropionibacterium sp.]|jgi:glycine cleavage system H protein|nr:glycine cleavage system protein GcvH [Acidipropionibacterium sp.]